jgi:hypothetical protein
MGRELDNFYNKGLDVLGDLYQTSSSETRSQLEQLYYQMGLLKNQAEIESEKIEQFQNIKFLLQEQLEYSLKLFVRRNKMGIVKTNWTDISKVSFSKLNRIVEVMPFSYFALKFFNIKRKVNYIIDENAIVASGEIDDLVDLDKVRSQAYALTKSMFARKVILTYEIDENEIEEKPTLRLIFDYSNHEDYTYAVKVDEKGSGTLGLPSNFKSYRITRDKFNKMDKHHIVIVTKDFQVKKVLTSPEKLRAKLPKSEIIHFPFLFRPLSLIIPREGEILYSPQIMDNISTGCMDAPKQELAFQNKTSNNFIYFDFFSLFTE